MKKFIVIIIPFFIIFCLSLVVVKPLFIQGYFPMHDNTQIQRVSEMGKALKDGMFPVRWAGDLGYGYGYPIFNFYAPLAYYFGGFLTIFGIDPIVATKTMMGLPILLAGVFMFFLGKEFWGRVGGVVASAFYLFAPYVALDLYVRGDVSELWAYAFIPLTVFSLWKLSVSGKIRYVFLASFAYATVILSHNLTAFMVTPFLLIFIFLLFRITKRSVVKFMLFFSVFLGIMLASFYWIPALFEMQYTNVSSQVGGAAHFRDHFICPSQLWNSPWGFGGSVQGCKDGLSFKLGKLNIITGFFLIILTYIPLRRKIEKRNILWFAGIFLFFTLFLTLHQSQIIWETLSPMAFFQYPWRFLLLASFFIAFIIGSFPQFLNIFMKKPLATLFFSGVLVILLITVQYEILSPQTIFPLSAQEATDEKTIKWTTSKISDEYMPKNFEKPKNENDIVREKIAVSLESSVVTYLTLKTHLLDAEITSAKEEPVLIKTAYFPAWELAIDGKKSAYTPTSKGLVFMAPKGRHILGLHFEQTLIEKISNILSLGGIFILFTGIIYASKKRIL